MSKTVARDETPGMRVYITIAWTTEQYRQVYASTYIAMASDFSSTYGASDMIPLVVEFFEQRKSKASHRGHGGPWPDHV